jgi:uncharacterized protein with FMN-binding domain
MLRLIATLALLLGVAAAPPPGSDQIELLDGTQYNGKLLKESPETIRFEVEIPGGGGKAQIDIPTKSIYVIAVAGKKRVLNEKAGKAAAPSGDKTAKAADPAAPKAAGAKTKPEVLTLVKQLGSTPPDWFAATPLNFPPSLDLTWTPPPQGTPWDPNKNVSQFIWSTINENEPRWKEGIKFLHHLLVVNQNKPNLLPQIMEALGNMYHNLHQDWARAAFWWQKSGRADPIDLAHCYFKLGSKDMAVEQIKGFSSDDTRHGSLIRLWCEMGETAKALQMAEATARSTPDVGNLAAGDVCRAAGRYPEAIAYYQKAVAAGSGARDIAQNKKRAQASMDAIQLVEALDLKKIKDGKYKADSIGYAGPVEVEVAVAGGKITDVRVSNHHEKQYYSSITETCGAIIKKQGAKGVDATAAATITSEAIINASMKAVAKGK